MRIYVSIILGVIISMAAQAQGPLAPSGTPGPMMKTLNQVEPRIPITSVPFTISQPGSYYMASNLTCSVAGSNGISITTSDVTLDLCGFSLTGPGSTSGNGIDVNGVNVHIRNGIVSAWNGYDKNGIYFTGAASSLQDIEIRNCSSGVYFVNPSALVSDCMVQGVGSTGACYGIHTSHGSVIRNSLVGGISGGSSGYGIYVGEDCIITGCNVWDVKSTATNGAAVRAYKGDRITDCVVNFNGVPGIIVWDRCVVENNTINDNGLMGARVAGISLLGHYNRIQNNQIAQNYYGLSFALGSETNFVFGNTIVQNTTNISGSVANNHIGPLNSAIGTPTNHPWANFVF